jgi:hypothetical protein
MTREEILSDGLEQWRASAFEVCRRRGWSLECMSRLAAATCEAVELTDAVRGKSGDVVEEAGDLLFTALAMIPPDVPLSSVLARNREKVASLLDLCAGRIGTADHWKPCKEKASECREHGAALLATLEER